MIRPLLCTTLTLTGAIAHASAQSQQTAEPALFRIEWALPSGLMAMQGQQAGHAFILSMSDGAPLIAVTAHHVMQVTPETRWDEIAPMVRSARLRNAADGSITLPLGAFLPINGAQRIGAAGSQHDLAAFAVLNASAEQTLRFADHAAAVGDTVWVLAARLDGNPRLRHPARVTTSNDSSFRYVYLVEMNANWTSGAAVLDRSNRVVGVNVGTLGNNGGVVGMGVGWAAMREQLALVVSR